MYSHLFDKLKEYKDELLNDLIKLLLSIPISIIKHDNYYLFKNGFLKLLNFFLGLILTLRKGF